MADSGTVDGAMDQDAIRAFISATYPGVDIVIGSKEAGSPELAWGDTFFVYDPDRILQGNKQFPFATMVTKDYGEFDNASNLNRPGVFRLNIGLSKETYNRFVGSGAEHDYTALDQVMPHPVYGQYHWVCILNPSDATFRDRVTTLLQEAYDRAVERYARGARTVADRPSS